MKRVILTFLCVGTLFAGNNDILTIHDRYEKALTAFDHHNWWKVRQHTRAIMELAPNNPYRMHLHYMLGHSYFGRGEYDLANEHFNSYLEFEGADKRFDEIMEYKFEIAKAYARGHRKRVEGMRLLPKLAPAKMDGIQILDEIVSSKPRTEMAAEALLIKGQLLTDLHLYKEAVEAYQTLTRRYPKHENAAKSFVCINEVYLERLKVEFIDQDLIALAENNLERFRKSFPTHPKLAEGEKVFLEMKETLASDLLDTGRFYERRKKKGAAKLYYDSVIARFPETNAAIESQKRLAKVST
ncbi:MAG: Cell division coordinator CpoB [Chlamydiia bacterium]|nr:Cell division coordinator CpoB [Chlamydiia bacterium]MCH9616530.1 Cell division coordinator CpoB [Chlamydiia bacterium]MCH9629260.1 Cell division coordinator CpoB [Chlamydiia bacterium]